DAVRFVQLRFERRAADAGGSFLARAGDALDLARSWNITANDVVVGVGEENAAVVVEAEMLGAVERGIAGGAAVAGEALLARPRDGANLALRIDDAQGVAAALEEV